MILVYIFKRKYEEINHALLTFYKELTAKAENKGQENEELSIFLHNFM